MACYDFDYAMKMLCQAIDLAEIEQDFAPLRRWVNEVEQSGREMRTIEARLNAIADQEFLLAPLQSIADGHLEADYEDRVSMQDG
jgi:hypothetical protein